MLEGRLVNPTEQRINNTIVPSTIQNIIENTFHDLGWNMVNGSNGLI